MKIGDKPATTKKMPTLTSFYTIFKRKTFSPTPGKNNSFGPVSKAQATAKIIKKQPKVDLDNEDGTTLCPLCNRDSPVLFYQNEEQIKRIPERSLTPFLSEVKADLLAKAVYLKFIRVTQKFI